MQAAETDDNDSVVQQNECDPPTSPNGLVDRVIRRGEVAVELHNSRFYYVLRRAPVTAGEFEVAEAGTLAEWEDCDPSSDVLIVLNISEAIEKSGIDDLASAREAIANQRLFERARPANKLAPALNEFLAAENRGEWNGLADYVKEVSK